MIYLKKFDSHASYDTEINGGGVDISLPNVSYCEDVKDVHYTPYNLVRFYVGDITGTTPQTVKIIYANSSSIPIQVSEGNKWYTYVLPKDKGLYKIFGNSVKKVVVKADITTNGKDVIIPSSTIEASFKGSNTSNLTLIGGMFLRCSGLTSLDVSSFNTSNVTDMHGMFKNCVKLETLDLSGWDTSKVTDMLDMFKGCTSLRTITMVGCTTETINKIKAQLTTDGIINNVTIG